MAMTSPISPDESYVVSPLSAEERSTPMRNTSANWPGPGIFVKMDFGVALSPNISKRVSFGYASRNIDESILGSYHSPGPGPGNRNMGHNEPSSSGAPRTIRRGFRSRSALQLRTSPVSPVSISSGYYSPEHVYQDYYREYRSSPGTPSTHHNGGSSSGPRLPYPAVRQTTVDRKPLPPLPSFRLGQDLPWTSPTATWMHLDDGGSSYYETENVEATAAPRTDEDPQRTRELAELHEAMMAVDLADDVWHPGGTRNPRVPQGPRELGWAIAIPTGDDARAAAGREHSYRDRYSCYGEQRESPPPAYSVGQWGWDWEWEERGGYWVRGRPRRTTHYA